MPSVALEGLCFLYYLEGVAQIHWLILAIISEILPLGLENQRKCKNNSPFSIYHLLLVITFKLAKNFALCFVF